MSKAIRASGVPCCPKAHAIDNAHANPMMKRRRAGGRADIEILFFLHDQDAAVFLKLRLGRTRRILRVSGTEAFLAGDDRSRDALIAEKGLNPGGAEFRKLEVAL